MRRVVAPTLIVALPSSRLAAQPAGGRDDQREIHAIEEALAQALHRRSRSQLDSLLAPDFVLRSTPGITESERETYRVRVVSGVGVIPLPNRDDQRR